MSKYSEEFKLKIVKEHKETNIGAKSLQRKYGVHHSQSEQWIKKKLKYYLTKSSIVLGFKKTIIWHKKLWIDMILVIVMKIQKKTYNYYEEDSSRCDFIGDFYKDEEDYEMAIKWYSRAVDEGSEETKEKLEELKNKKK